MERDAEWQPFFAILPVRVDAYTEEEKNKYGFNFLRVGRLERRLSTFVDDDDSHTVISVWRYRLPRGERV
jgi:hypothetical protein